MKTSSVFWAIILAAFVTVAHGDMVWNIDSSGLGSNDGEGDITNLNLGDVIVVEVGDETTLTSISWDLQYFAFAPSLRSEMWYAIGDTYVTGTSGLAGAYVNPGAGDDVSGIAQYDSGGEVTLASLGFASITLTDSNGDSSNDFYIEIFESFVNTPNAPEGVFGASSVGNGITGLRGFDFRTIMVPEPGTSALLALLGGVALIRCRRRR